MRSLPIQFSKPMVLALLAGTKTQTRRLFKGKLRHSVGDRLYVREHWRTFVSLDAVPPRDLWRLDGERGAGVWYEADGSGMALTAAGMRSFGPRDDRPAFGKFRQAMHMPKWASRMTLVVTGSRVERLQDISEADALAEGMTQATADAIMEPEELAMYAATHILCPEARGRILYETIWEQINGADSWALNPEVAVTSFAVGLHNIEGIQQ